MGKYSIILFYLTDIDKGKAVVQAVDVEPLLNQTRSNAKQVHGIQSNQ